MQSHRCYMSFLMIALVILLAAISFAQQGKGNYCTLAGTWYGGSVVSYQVTYVPAGPAGQYIVIAEGMYKSDVMNTAYTGIQKKSGANRYQGSGMALVTQDPDFLNLPPIGKLPDLMVGWFEVELLDCNTLKNTIPLLGMYIGKPTPPFAGIWKPGTPWSGIDWVVGGKAPLVDPPDVDMIPILTGDTKPIVETYHRLPATVNPSLLHSN